MTFPLRCDQGHAARCFVAPASDLGWDIRVEFDEGVIFTRHCTEWHRVERLCAQLERRFWDQSAPSLSAH